MISISPVNFFWPEFFLYYCAMARIYKYYPSSIPPDATDIYIRILSESNYPVLAQYNSTTGVFTASDTGFEYPHYVVISWRLA